MERKSGDAKLTGYSWQLIITDGYLIMIFFPLNRLIVELGTTKFWWCQIFNWVSATISDWLLWALFPETQPWQIKESTKHAIIAYWLIRMGFSEILLVVTVSITIIILFNFL